MASRVLIYGCTGHSGMLIAQKARERPVEVILAGRDANRVQRLAGSLGCSWRCARLDDPNSLDRMLANVDVVINSAGPFSGTACPVVEACLRVGVHYLDITGELPVFQYLAQYDQEAQARGIMVMPGVGFAITATDCLAAHMKRRMPSARYLRVGISMPKSLSRGSMRTMIELVRDHVNICRGGKIISIPVGRLERVFDYGDGDRRSACINWPDVYTAAGTTGIPNIEVYIEADFLSRSLYLTGALFAVPLQLRMPRTLLRFYADIMVAPALRGDISTGEQIIVAEAEDYWRQCVRSRLNTMDGYAFTALSSVEVAHRTLKGEIRPGFQTPSRVYGPDLVLGIDGTTRQDIESRQSEHRN